MNSTKYSADVRITMVIEHGLRSNTTRKAYMKAGSGPQNLCKGLKESVKKAYSEPDLGTTAPSSAKAKAPRK